MGQTRREVVFSARDGGVADLMSRLRQSANELGRDMVRDAQANTTNAQDAVRYYEDQVKLLEKRNRLSREGARAELASNYDRDSNVRGANQAQLKKQYQGALKDIGREGREDNIQTDLLRELIDTVKMTSNDEIKTEDKNSLRETTSVNKAFLAGAGTEFTQLNDQLVSEGGGTPSSRGKSRVNIGGMIRGVSGSGDSVGAVSSVLENVNDIPFAGIITGIIGASVAALSIRATRETSAGVAAALGGTDVAGILDSGAGQGARRYGVSREEFLSNNLTSAIRASGTAKGAEARAMAGLEVERGFGVGSDSVTVLEKLARVTEDASNSQMVAAKVYSSMYGITDPSKMGSYMESFGQFQQGQWMNSGVTDPSGTLGLMRGMTQLGGNMKFGDYMMSSLGSLNQGISQGGTAEAQAIKFDILRRQNPDKSYFELQAEMEKGVGSKGYVSGMLNFVKQTGGGMNAQSILLDQLTGGSMRKSDIMAMINGNLDPNAVGGASDPDFRNRAMAASSGAQAELLNFTEKFKDVMSPIGEGIERMIGKLDELIKIVDD